MLILKLYKNYNNSYLKDANLHNNDFAYNPHMIFLAVTMNNR